MDDGSAAHTCMAERVEAASYMPKPGIRRAVAFTIANPIFVRIIHPGRYNPDTQAAFHSSSGAEMRVLNPSLRPAVMGLAAMLSLMAVPVAQAQTDWTTFGFSAQRTGYNPNETMLSQGNAPGLHLLWSKPVHGPMLTQPTLLSGVGKGSYMRDLLYVGTLYGDMYGFDAATGAQVWHTVLPAVQTNCSDFSAANGNAGVIGTPTIDRPNGRMFVVAGDGKLHALSISNGGELPGWPLSVFDAPNAPPRTLVYGSPTLDAARSLLYLATASACDFQPYHGEVIQVGLAGPSVLRRWFVTGQTGPNGGGIWGPGGVSYDGTFLYALTGNAFSAPEDVPYAEHVVKLSRTLGVIASSGPALSGTDVDFGATPLLFQAAGCPPQLAAMNKSGGFFIYDRGTIPLGTGPRQRLQISGTQNTSQGDFVGIPAYDPDRQRLFFGNPSDFAGLYKHGLIALSITPQCVGSLAWQVQVGLNNVTYNNPMIPPAVANGVVYYSSGDASRVFAFNADTGRQLWNSGTLISGGVFAAPMVANGKLFVAGYTSQAVYAFGP